MGYVLSFIIKKMYKESLMNKEWMEYKTRLFKTISHIE